MLVRFAVLMTGRPPSIVADSGAVPGVSVNQVALLIRAAVSCSTELTVSVLEL